MLCFKCYFKLELNDCQNWVYPIRAPHVAYPQGNEEMCLILNKQ